MCKQKKNIDDNNLTEESTENLDKTDETEEITDEECICNDMNLEQCREQLDVLRVDNEALQNQLQRAMADYANLRLRSEKEKLAIIKSSNQNFICKLLPALDNFERAIEAKEEDLKSKGILMIYKQLVNVLKEEGLKQIKAIEEEFDPRLHDALMVEETKDFENNTVVEVFETGYLFKDKLIRAAKVKVARNKEDA